MDNNQIIKHTGNGLIQKVGNAISVTNKLLATTEPQLIPYRKKDKWGFCTPDKKIVIDCVYTYVRPFRDDGFAEVFINGRWVMIDRNTNLLAAEYSYSNFRDGLAIANFEGKYGIIDIKHNIIIPFIYDDIRNFKEGLAKVKKDNKYGFINIKGDVVVPIIYEYNAYQFSDGMAQVTLNEKNGFVNLNGDVVVPIIYDKKFSCFEEGFACIQTIEGKKGFINKTGEIVVPFIYDNSDFSFSEGLVSVRKNGKWGFINCNNRVVIPFIYEFSTSFHDGLANVDINNKWGFINKEGIVIIPANYEQNSPYHFQNGICIAKMSTGYGFIIKKGKLLCLLFMIMQNHFILTGWNMFILNTL